MKYIYLSFIVLLSAVSIISCQQEDLDDNTGYLRIDVETNTYVNTKIAEDYNPKQIALQIVDSKGEVVESTDDWETMLMNTVMLL